MPETGTRRPHGAHAVQSWRYARCDLARPGTGCCWMMIGLIFSTWRTRPCAQNEWCAHAFPFEDGSKEALGAIAVS